LAVVGPRRACERQRHACHVAEPTHRATPACAPDAGKINTKGRRPAIRPAGRNKGACQAVARRSSNPLNDVRSSGGVGRVELALSLAWLFLVTWLIVGAMRRYRAFDQVAPMSLRDREPADTVTVVVPARDEADDIGNCLGDLIAQDYPRDRLHVVVVDDHS